MSRDWQFSKRSKKNKRQSNFFPSYSCTSKTCCVVDGWSQPGNRKWYNCFLCFLKTKWWTAVILQPQICSNKSFVAYLQDQGSIPCCSTNYPYRKDWQGKSAWINTYDIYRAKWLNSGSSQPKTKKRKATGLITLVCWLWDKEWQCLSRVRFLNFVGMGSFLIIISWKITIA